MVWSCRLDSSVIEQGFRYSCEHVDELAGIMEVREVFDQEWEAHSPWSYLATTELLLSWSFSTLFDEHLVSRVKLRISVWIVTF
jgi:hypothetical protein